MKFLAVAIVIAALVVAVGVVFAQRHSAHDALVRECMQHQVVPAGFSALKQYPGVANCEKQVNSAGK